MTVGNVLMCAALALIELMIVVQIRMMLPILKHMFIYVRAKATIIKGYQCGLSYTTNTKICEFNANTNHYHDRLNYYQKAMLRYHAISRNNCENYVRHLPNSHLSRTVKPKPTAFHTDSDQQESISKNQGKIQAPAFDQDIYGVWV